MGAFREERWARRRVGFLTAKASELRSRRSEAMAVDRWCRYAEELANFKESVAARVMGRRGIEVWRNWLFHHAASLQLTHGAAAAWGERAPFSFFVKWARRAAMERAKRVVMKEVRGRAMQRGLAAWKEWRRWILLLSARSSACRATHVERLALQAFLEWKERRGHARLLSQLRDASESHAKKLFLSLALGAWWRHRSV